jgi:hypothetical protein
VIRQGSAVAHFDRVDTEPATSAPGLLVVADIPARAVRENEYSSTAGAARPIAAVDGSHR